MMFKNYQQASDCLSSFTSQSFMFTHVDNSRWNKYTLFLFPQNRFLGIFNRLIKYQKSYIFSIEKRAEKKYAKALYNKLIGKNDKDVASALDLENSLGAYNNQWGEDDYKRAEWVAKTVFSDEFIQANKIDGNLIKDKISEIRLKNSKALQNSRFVPPYRIEEIREDFRVILCISGIDLDIKLSFSPLSDEGINNPITRYYHNKYDYKNFTFQRFASIHDVLILEEIGHQMIPLALNNRQFFQIKCNMFTDDDNIIVKVTRSANSLKAQITPIINLMDICFGEDAYGRSYYSKEDQMELKNLPNNGQLILPCGERIYSGPEYDILLTFQPILEKDSEENEALISVLKIHVWPFENKPIEKKGVYQHQLMYDWFK